MKVKILSKISRKYITQHTATTHKLHGCKDGQCKDIMPPVLKVASSPPECRQCAHLPDIGHWARRRIDRWARDAWPVWRQTCSYLPSRRASPPFDQYQNLLRRLSVNNLPKAVTWQRIGRDLNPWPLDHKSDAITARPQQRLSRIQSES